REELGFKGLIFTDALVMKGVAGTQHPSLAAIKAGNDMALIPHNIEEEIETVIQAIKNGDLSEEVINRKCKKVLTYKYALGVAHQEKIRISGLSQRINTPYARDLGNRLNEAAVTVASNKDQILPLHSDVKRIAMINVGSTGRNTAFEYALRKHVAVKRIQLNPNIPGAERKVLRDTLSTYKRIVVCISDERLAPYKEFFSELPAGMPIVYIFFTPEKSMVTLEAGLSNASAVVLAHSGEKNIQEHTASILFGKAAANGRLSTSVGNLFKAGDGVIITPQIAHHFIPEEYGVQPNVLERIDNIAREGIDEGAYSGCQVVVLKDGKRVYSKAFGTFSGEGSEKVTPSSIFDIASLSKTSGTLLAIMKLYDNGMLRLSDKVSTYLPFLENTDKKNITIRELLLHESGLPSSIFFYLQAIDKNSYEGRLYKTTRDKLHTVQIGTRTFVQPNFKFFKGLTSDKSSDVYTIQASDRLWLDKSFHDSITARIAGAKLGDKTYRYSCVGFILLQKLTEKISGLPLDKFLNKEFYTPMGLNRTAYQPLRYFRKEDIVPSSRDDFLRKTTVQGFVHDESAAFQGGVSGNAGIFSTAEEIAIIHQMILNGGELNGKRYLSKETCRLFTTEKSRASRRGLGFDKPDIKNPGKNPCAKSASASTYGHDGFTGACAWVDPENKLVYVFLSNRTYPDVWANKLAKLQIREHIQDTIYESLK
ncbi:MAG: serine hydrolase, partial [Mediterranea sp.]|nr:serine hydrolase [Mediterranea sp.]